MTSPDETPKKDTSPEPLDLSGLDAVGSDYSIGSSNLDSVDLRVAITSSPLPTTDPVASTKSSTQPAAAVAPAASPIAPPAAAPVKKAAAKKAAVASPASGAAAAPASTPSAPASSPAAGTAPTATTVLITGFEADNSDDFIRSLNFARIADTLSLQMAIPNILLEIEHILLSINNISTQIGIDHINFIYNTPRNTTEFLTTLENIKQSCSRFLIGLTRDQNINPTTKRNLTLSVRHVSAIIQKSSMSTIDATERINTSTPNPPPASKAPTPPPITPPSAPTVPTVDSNIQDLNKAWAEAELFMQDDDKTYEEKLMGLKAFIQRINYGQFGDVSKEPIKTRLEEYNTLLKECESVAGKFNSDEVLSSGIGVIQTATKIKQDAESVEKNDDFGKITARATALRSAFNTRARNAKKIEIEYDQEIKGQTKTKKKTVEIRNPLVFEILYGNIRKEVNNLIGEDFFSLQETRVADLEKNNESEAKAKTAIDAAITEIKTAITNTPNKISAISPGGAITETSWERFVNSYYGELNQLQNKINEQINKVQIIVRSTPKVKGHALSKIQEIGTIVNDFNNDYRYGNVTNMGIKMIPIHNIYTKVEGVADDKNNIKSWATPFIKSARIQVPALGGALGGSAMPGAPGGSAVHDSAGLWNASMKQAWDRAGPTAKWGMVGVGVLLAAVVIYLTSGRRDGDEEGGKDKKAKAEETAKERTTQIKARDTKLDAAAKAREDKARNVANMTPEEVLAGIQIKDGEMETFTGAEMLSLNNYEGLENKRQRRVATARENLEFNALTCLITDFSKTAFSEKIEPAPRINRVRLLQMLTGEAAGSIPTHVTVATTNTAVIRWALDPQKAEEKFVIFQRQRGDDKAEKRPNGQIEIGIYIRGDETWRKGIENEVRQNMAGNNPYYEQGFSPGTLNNDRMKVLFNGSEAQKNWEAIDKALYNGGLGGLVKNKMAYFKPK